MQYPRNRVLGLGGPDERSQHHSRCDPEIQSRDCNALSFHVDPVGGVWLRRCCFDERDDPATDEEQLSEYYGQCPSLSVRRQRVSSLFVNMPYLIFERLLLLLVVTTNTRSLAARDMLVSDVTH
jgi:hypothetical protein